MLIDCNDNQRDCVYLHRFSTRLECERPRCMCGTDPVSLDYKQDMTIHMLWCARNGLFFSLGGGGGGESSRKCASNAIAILYNPG